MKRVLILLLILLVGCTTITPEPVAEPQETGVDVVAEVKLPSSWHYQLQNTDFQELKSLDVDLLVIDLDDSELSKEQVDTLSENKLVFSYLSIGEAENYRSYWVDWEIGNPKFVHSANPYWEGNYKVEFWNEEWQQIIFNQIKNIESKNYDGIYLDIVDAYEFFDKKQEMIEFIEKIDEQTDLLIITQNANELYPETKDFIEGIAREDLWFDDDEYTEYDDQEYSLDFLEQARDDKKLVLSIDYPTTNVNICDYHDICSQFNFICTVSNRDLDLSEGLRCEE